MRTLSALLLLMATLLDTLSQETIDIGCNDPYLVVGDNYTLSWPEDELISYRIFALYYIEDRLARSVIIANNVLRRDMPPAHPHYTWSVTAPYGITPVRILIEGFNTHGTDTLSDIPSYTYVSPIIDTRDPSDAPIRFGDLNNNGVLDGCDDYLYDDIIGRQTTDPSERQIAIADLNGDGTVTIGDQNILHTCILREYVRGDVNDSGHLTTLDVLLVRRHILSPDKTFLKPYQQIFADMNNDGTLSTLDILLMRRDILQP